MKIRIKDIRCIVDVAKTIKDMFAKENTQTSQQAKEATGEQNVEITEDMTSDEEDRIIEQTKKDLNVCTLGSPIEVLSSLNTFTQKAMETIQFCEVQETKRETIRCERDFRISQLEAQRDIILSYLERSFDERRDLFDKQFKIVDYALQTGNNEQLSMALQNINNLANSSPFKALADIGNVQRSLMQENSTFDI